MYTNRAQAKMRAREREKLSRRYCYQILLPPEIWKTRGILVLRAFIYIIRLHISPHQIYVNYMVSIGIPLIRNRYKFVNLIVDLTLCLPETSIYVRCVGKSTYIQTNAYILFITIEDSTSWFYYVIIICKFNYHMWRVSFLMLNVIFSSLI